MTELTHTTRYGVADTKFEGDYYEIILTAGHKTWTFGDYYHDKGREKADGFISGLKVCYPNLKVTFKKVASYHD